MSSPEIFPGLRHFPATSLHVKIKNRRKRYLDTHPTYFSSTALELAEAPLLHDRLIRRFQTPSERAAEAKKKGYAGVLETDLWRSEAKMEALRKGTHKPRTSNKRANIKKDRVIGSTCVDSQGEDDGIDFDDIYELPSSKEEGLQIWREEMERRFLAGRDEDFDYGEVDAGHEDDGLEEAKEEEERWFEEDERWMEENEDGEEEREGKGHELKGQTGVQDF